MIFSFFKVKRLKLVNKIICIQISERDLAQKLNFSCKQQDFFIYIDDVIVINIHDMQSEELFIWLSLNIHFFLLHIHLFLLHIHFFLLHIHFFLLNIRLSQDKFSNYSTRFNDYSTRFNDYSTRFNSLIIITTCICSFINQLSITYSTSLSSWILHSSRWVNFMWVIRSSSSSSIHKLENST